MMESSDDRIVEIVDDERVVPRIQCGFHRSPLSHGGGKVVVGVVCRLVCQIRRLLEENTMRNQRVLSPWENLLKNKSHPRMKTWKDKNKEKTCDQVP